MAEIDFGDVRAIMLGLMAANEKLDEIIYILGGENDEEAEDEIDT